jgi:hypothetical protein
MDASKHGDSGFIVIHRKIFDNPLVRDGDRFRAWVWLIGEAAWKVRRVRIRSGRGSKLIDLDRGQLSHSLRFFARAWGWSIKRVRTFLDDLEADEMIVMGEGHRKGTQTTTQTGTQKGTDQNIITICNYSSYQDAGIGLGTQSGTQTGTQSSQNGHKEEQLTKKKDISSSKKNPLGWPSDAFERWYQGYPKKVDKIAGRKAFEKVQAAGEMSFDDLIGARDRYAAQVRATDPQYIKAPAAWLKKGAYLDEPSRPSADVIQIQPARAPTTFTDQDWTSRVRQYKSDGTWSNLWGPRPGHSGCLVPSHLTADCEISGGAYG